MDRRKRTMILAALAMLGLILDAKTAVTGASEGIRLCIRAVIPSLFPFFFLSSFITAGSMGADIPLLRPILRLCRMPEGSGSILAVGLLGGYPMGANSIAQAYAQGQLSERDARRLLGFCSNAGPAFLFGMLGSVFSSPVIPTVLWCIHIFSAVMTGALLPGGSNSRTRVQPGRGPSADQALSRSLSAMARICGWIVLFRVLLAFGDRYLLSRLPQGLGVLIYGLTELSNGCCALSALTDPGSRFVMASVFLAFGGLCVAAQTAQVTADAGLGLGMYLTGKLIQTALSFVLSAAVQPLLFPREQRAAIPSFAFFLILIPVFLLIFQKKSSFSRLTRV